MSSGTPTPDNPRQWFWDLAKKRRALLPQRTPEEQHALRLHYDDVANKAKAQQRQRDQQG